MLDAVLAGDAGAVAALLDADPQLRDLADRGPHRGSVLHHAAARGNLSVVELLLAAGADAGKRDQHGRTPLHLAAAAGHLPVARALVEAGAAVGARMTGAGSAWEAAENSGHRQLADYLRDRWLSARRSTAGSAAEPHYGLNHLTKNNESGPDAD
jgi:ankyrin repeat protein